MKKKDLKNQRFIASDYYDSIGRIDDRMNRGILVFNQDKVGIYANKSALDCIEKDSLENLNLYSEDLLFDGNKFIDDSFLNKVSENPGVPLSFPYFGSFVSVNGKSVNVIGSVTYLIEPIEGLGNVFELVFIDLVNVVDDSIFFKSIKNANVFPFFYDAISGMFRFPFFLPTFLENDFDSKYINIRDLVDYVNPSESEKLFSYVKKVIELDQLEKLFSDVWYIKNNVGEYVWYEVRFKRFEIPGEQDGRITIGSFINVQNVYDKLSFLANKETEATNSVQMQKNFLSSMSHDIRTPLNSILGFSNLLFDKNISEDYKKEYSNIINQNGHILLTLVNDIIDLSKIESGDLSISPKMVNVVELFKNSETIMRGYKSNENLIVTYHYLYSKLVIYIDDNRFLQVIMNLVSNAIKYTILGNVDVWLDYLDGELILKVMDTGIGIPETKQRFVFKPFQKLDNHAKGNGLGLSIVAKIVDLMGGTYGFSSVENEGSTFWVHIPVLVDDKSIKRII